MSVLIGLKYGFTKEGNHGRLISSHFHALQKDQGNVLLDFQLSQIHKGLAASLRGVPIN